MASRDGAEPGDDREMETGGAREVVVKYHGGPLDGDVATCRVENRLAVYSMVLATKGQPYLIRRKLVASIYRFDRWTADESGTPIAVLNYVRSEDHLSAAKTIAAHRDEYVDAPKFDE